MKNLPLFFIIFFFSLIGFFSCDSGTSGKYNLQLDDPDSSDETYSSLRHPTDLPSTVDFRTSAGAFPPVFSEGPINSCTANAASAAIYYDMVKQQWKEPFVPSRMFIYYNERKIEDKLDESKYGTSGAPVKLRDCIKTIHEQGYCEESMWPYEANKIYVEPSAQAYNNAQQHKTYQYQRIKSEVDHLKSCLAEGYPFLFGFSIYKSFESVNTQQTGIVPMPKKGEKKLGGHAALVVGYDDAKKHFIFRNSYGTSWGDGGYGYISFEFMMKYGFDFWVIKKV